MKTTSSRRGRKSSVCDHSCTSSPIAPRISLRAWELTDRVFHSSSTSPAAPSGPAATVVTARTARSSARRSEIRCSARRSTRRSNRIRTDLISPSSASAPWEVQALYQTVCTSGACASSASTSRIKLLLPIPQPASTASVNGVEAREATSSPASWRAARPTPSRSAPDSATGSSLSSTKGPRGEGAGVPENGETGGGKGAEVDMRPERTEPRSRPPGTPRNHRAPRNQQCPRERHRDDRPQSVTTRDTPHTVR